MIGLAILVRRHANDLVALHLGLEGTADTAVRAGCDNRMIRLAVIDDALLHERRGRACLHAGAAGDTFRAEEVLADTGGDFGVEAAALDGESKRALNLVTGTHTARADDALRGIELEIGVAGVDRCVEVILAVEAVAHIAQPDGACHVLQFAVAIG